MLIGSYSITNDFKMHLQKKFEDTSGVIRGFTSFLLMVGGSLRVLRLLPPLKKTWSPWYSWNIAESGVKHNKSNLSNQIQQQLKRAKANQKNNSSILFRNNENNIIDWLIYQFLAHGRWFPPGTPAFSTTKKNLVAMI
jgi:hypothetical protein